MQSIKKNFQEQIRMHRLSKIGIIAGTIFGCICLIWLVKFLVSNRTYDTYEVVKEMASVGAKEAITLSYDQNILSYSNDGMSAYNIKGEQLWNQTYEMQSPIVDVNGTYVAVADYKGGTIYVMDTKGLTAHINTNKIILEITISEQGLVTATLEDGEITWLNLYSVKGDEIVTIKTTLNKSGFPIQASASADNQKLGVSFLKIRGNSIGSSIAFYNFGDVGQNATDKIVSGYDYDKCVIPFLKYISEGTALAIGEDQISIYQGKQIPELRKEVKVDKGIKSVFYGKEYFALVYLNEDKDDKYRLDLYNLEGDIISSTGFAVEYKDIIISSKSMVVYNEAEVLILSIKGKIRYEGDLGGEIKTIIPTGKENKYTIIRKEGVESIKLK